jgi:TonB family protein
VLTCILSLNSGTAQKRGRQAHTKRVQEIYRDPAESWGTLEEQGQIFQDCFTSNETELGVNPGATRPLLCMHALSLPKPEYPAVAKEAKAAGSVAVKVLIDEKGRAIRAVPIQGHPLLHLAAKKAACRVRYSPLIVNGKPVRFVTQVNYGFQL